MERNGRGRAVGVLAFLVACLVTVTAGPAQGETRLVFGHILDDSTAHHRHMLWAAGEIQRALQGRVHLQVVPRGQLGTTDMQVVEGFKRGTTQMAYLSFGHLVEMYPNLSIGAGPFVFRDFAHWQSFRDSTLLTDLVADFEKTVGMKVFGLAYYGERHVSSKAPITSLEALKGLAIRVPSIPITILTFRALGAKPVPIPFKETYQALKEGIVDAQENPFPAIKAMRFHEVTPVINLTAHISDAQLVVMDGQAWRSIPAGDQAVLQRVFGEAAGRVTNDVRAEELRLKDEFAKSGVTIQPVDRVPLIAHLTPRHRDGTFPWKGDLIDRIQALR